MEGEHRTRRTRVVGLVILLSGAILLGASLYHPIQSMPVMRGPATIPFNSPYLAFQGSYDSASGQETLSGSLQGPGCCVSFYVFTYDAFNNWTANRLEATGPSNSPILNLSSESIILGDRFSSALPSGGYFMVFYNENSALWHSNTTSTTGVDANISLDYQTSPYGLASYPSVTLLCLGLAIIVATWLPPRYHLSSARRSALIAVAVFVVVAILLFTIPEILLPASASSSYPIVQEAQVNTPSGMSDCLVAGLQIDCGVSIVRGESGSITVIVANGATGTVNLGIQFSVNSTGGSNVQLTSAPACAYSPAPTLYSSSSCLISANSTQSFSFDFASSQTYAPSNETSIILSVEQTCCFP